MSLSKGSCRKHLIFNWYLYATKVVFAIGLSKEGNIPRAYEKAAAYLKNK